MCVCVYKRFRWHLYQIGKKNVYITTTMRNIKKIAKKKGKNAPLLLFCRRGEIIVPRKNLTKKKKKIKSKKEKKKIYFIILYTDA